MLKYLTTAVLNCIRNLLEEHLTQQLTDDLGEAGFSVVRGLPWPAPRIST